MVLAHQVLRGARQRGQEENEEATVCEVGQGFRLRVMVKGINGKPWHVVSTVLHLTVAPPPALPLCILAAKYCPRPFSPTGRTLAAMYCPQRSNRSRASWPSEAHAHSSLLMGAGARGAVFSGIVA